MSKTSPAIPESFHVAYQHIKQLEQYERYIGAFIFGSFARGEATEKSDLDVQVLVDEDNPCSNVNHPFIDGVRLDLSFVSLCQLKATTNEQMQKQERVPWIAESLIVFDKTGELVKLQEIARHVRPRGITTDDHQFIQFMFYHGNNKVERYLTTDPVKALFVMHVGLNDFLQFHSQIHQRWWVSSKRMLSDLGTWDEPLVELIQNFVVSYEIEGKYRWWSAIIDHILEPIGERQPIAENNCDCDICREDLSMFHVKHS